MTSAGGRVDRWAPEAGPLGLLRLVEARGTQPFLIDASRDQTLSYLECHVRATALASALRQRTGRGGRVVVVLENSPELALLYIACLYGNLVAVPISPLLAAREIDFIVRRSGAKLVACSPRTRPLLPEGLEREGFEFWPVDERGGAEGWSVDQAVPDADPGFEPLADVNSDALLAITFTSGTTSLPKGVAHRVGGLLGNAATFNAMMGFGSDRRFLHVFPMAYMAGFLNTLLGPLTAGASVVLGRPFDALSALRFWEPVVRYGVNTMWLAPTMLAALVRLDRRADAPAYCRAHLRTICVGTAPLPLKVKQGFETKYGVEVFESYGLSELLLVAGNGPRSPRVVGSVGRLLPGVELRIAGDQGAPQPIGAEGEIQVRTIYAMLGYVDYNTGQPVSSDDAWFPTGDIGRVSEDGDVFITGRKKDLIIRGGLNVSPRSVEEVLLQHEAVEQAAVVGMPHDFYGEEVVAVLKLGDGQAIDEIRASLQSWCRERLAAASIPTRWVQVQEFPTSVSGKIQKNELRQRLAGMA